MMSNYEALSPVGDRVLLRMKSQSETTTKSGIILTNTTDDDSNKVVEVVGVGPDVKLDIKPGDMVMCNTTMALKLSNDPDSEYKYMFITPPHIFAKVSVVE